jgi:hypothetical protein
MLKFGRTSKKALKWYAGWKGLKGVTKLVAIAAAGLGAYRIYQNRQFAEQSS